MHLKGYSLHKSCRVTKVCDFDQDKLSYCRSKYPDIETTTDSDSIFSDVSIDIVSIASYDSYHFEQICAALKSGKHVFVEKPFCLFEWQAIEIRKLLCANSRLQISSNLVLRTTPRFVKLKQKITDGHFGKIYYIEGDYNYGRLHKIHDGWRSKEDFYSIIYGGGIHLLDLMMWLNDDPPVEVCGFSNRILSDGTNFAFNDFNQSLIKLKSGVVLKLGSNFGCVYPHFHKLAVYGEKMTFENSINGGMWFENRDLPIYDYDGYPSDQKHDMILSFVDSILNPLVKPLVSADEMFKVMSVAFACEKAASSNKNILIEYL